MRLWILSDLHLEFAPFEVPNPPPSADVCVVAGDVLTKGVVPSLEWLGNEIAPVMPVVFVAGNHEFYRSSLSEGLANGLREAKRFPNVHFLENDSVVLGDITFVGCTLWTDFDLYAEQNSAMAAAQSSMSDYRQIKFSKSPYRWLSPHHLLRRHLDSRGYIEKSLAAAGTNNTVVVTHHAPSLLSIPPQPAENVPLSPAYASSLEGLIQALKPRLWIHGHVHETADYQLYRTRVVSNPRGYPDEVATSGFDPLKVIDI
jgi:Icc-related predicted phosphoesterase